MYLGIDVGGSKVAAAVVDPDGTIVESTKEPTDQSSEHSCAEQLTRLIEEHGARRTILAVGIGIPGIVNHGAGTVWAPNIKGWNHRRLLDDFRSLRTPVVLESDRNTALLGEMLYGKAIEKKDVLYLILGTGIGAGILSGGRLVRGWEETAGAVGWIPVRFRNRFDHFEKVASGPAIEALARCEGLELSLPDLAAAARGGDRRARALFSEVGDTVGQALATLVSTLNPELILIGGGAGRTWDLLEEAAREALHRWGQPVAIRRVCIEPGGLGEAGGVVGAAACAQISFEEGS